MQYVFRQLFNLSHFIHSRQSHTDFDALNSGHRLTMFPYASLKQPTSVSEIVGCVGLCN